MNLSILLSSYNSDNSLLVLIVTKEGEMSLWTFVGKVPRVATLKASDLIQRFEPPRVAVSSTHGVHPVVGLCVGHEGLARLVTLLIFQFLGHLVTVTNLQWEGSQYVSIFS